MCDATRIQTVSRFPKDFVADFGGGQTKSIVSRYHTLDLFTCEVRGNNCRLPLTMQRPQIL